MPLLTRLLIELIQYKPQPVFFIAPKIINFFLKFSGYLCKSLIINHYYLKKC